MQDKIEGDIAAVKYGAESSRSGVFQPHLLVNALRLNADRPTVRLADGTMLTGAAVGAEISRYVQALRALGVREGSRIGVLAANRIEVLHLTNAAMLVNCCMVPLHPMGAIDDYLYVASDASLEFLAFDPGAFGHRATELAACDTTIRQFISFGPAAIGSDICALAAGFSAAPLVAPLLTGNEIFRLSYSGGTTGKPKAIIGTHDYAYACTVIQMAEWEWPGEVRQLICAPLSHSGAALFLPTLLRGGCASIMAGFDPETVMATVERERITCMLLVPTMIYALLDHPRFGEFDLSSLETIFYGASAMSPTRLQEGIRKLGPVFFQFYGQAEAPMTVSVLRRAEHLVDDPARLASCGRPVPWVDVDLLDDRHQRVPDGTPGEICVRGPLVMTGYLNKPEQTAEALAGGWLHTGDVAVRDAQGFLRIVDRKKDMIITGGFNVYPREIEDVLGTHPAVSACGVIGVPDERWGECVKAVVVLRGSMTATVDELIALVRHHKGPVNAPKSVEFIDALPLTAIGKPDKKALRALFGQPASKEVNHA